MERREPEERPAPDTDTVRKELGERDREIDEAEQREDEDDDED